MNVPLLDLRREGPELDLELEDAFRRVLRSGHYILGPEVEALERECAQLVGVRHAIGVSSGTDALLLALMILGIGPGDEVICPTFTFFASAGAIWRVGAKPVFVDIKPCCFNLDPEDVIAKITSRTRAIMPVHLFGQCADMDPIIHAAHERNIPIIEDAAQAIGAQYSNKLAGALGTLGCISFFPSKNLGGIGDSGLLTTNDDELAERARIVRTHGAKPKYFHQVVGGNFRIDALQASLIRVRLRRLDKWIRQRQMNAKQYGSLLNSDVAATPNIVSGQCTTSYEELASGSICGLVLPAQCRSQHTYNQYVIRVDGMRIRDNLRNFLKKHGIGTEIYYPLPMHLQSCFAALGYKSGDFPNAERAAQETLALPIFPGLTTLEIAYVVQNLMAFASDGTSAG